MRQTRQETKAEKKKLAMAMRAKQLKAIGLKANERGQVKAEQSLLQQFVGLAEESGHSCNICREGYKFQPNKVCIILYEVALVSHASNNRVVPCHSRCSPSTPTPPRAPWSLSSRRRES